MNKALQAKFPPFWKFEYIFVCCLVSLSLLSPLFSRARCGCILLVIESWTRTTLLKCPLSTGSSASPENLQTPSFLTQKSWGADFFFHRNFKVWKQYSPSKVFILAVIPLSSVCTFAKRRGEPMTQYHDWFLWFLLSILMLKRLILIGRCLFPFRLSNSVSSTDTLREGLRQASFCEWKLVGRTGCGCVRDQAFHIHKLNELRSNLILSSHTCKYSRFVLTPGKWMFLLYRRPSFADATLDKTGVKEPYHHHYHKTSQQQITLMMMMWKIFLFKLY